MGAFGKQEGGGRRVSARSAAPPLAVLTTLVGSRSAVIADISATGIGLSGADLPPKGEELFVTVDRVQAFGTVIWSNEEECGIAFDVPLSPREEQALRQQTSVSRGLPAEIRAAFENWAVGCGR